VFRTKREDGRIVAVKIPSSLDESAGKSFIREVSIWQQLSHENIIALHDMNVFPTPYLELAYADGGSLDALKKPVEIEEASRLMFNIAEGLKHAHNQGIAHRDMKPQNILLTGDMTPKITDWGLSKVMAESKSSSRFGFTLIYAAPEQISPKKFGRPDFRTDIYQMGVIFYELATGKLPFNGEDFSEIGFAIISEEPEPPSVLNPECIELDSIILKCLNKQPDDRYKTIAEFQQDLAGYLKVEYKNSLAKSVGDLKRSCVYCGDLVLIHAKINDVEGALKYALDMNNYAGDAWSGDVGDIVGKLDYLVERKQPIGDELMSKINVVLHQLKMGR
ncbi:serine/threonine protein kinase, partial [bacterium]|nr:serine/threonine protein kinase [bacterium]